MGRTGEAKSKKGGWSLNRGGGRNMVKSKSARVALKQRAKMNRKKNRAMRRIRHARSHKREVGRKRSQCRKKGVR